VGDYRPMCEIEDDRLTCWSSASDTARKSIADRIDLSQTCTHVWGTREKLHLDRVDFGPGYTSSNVMKGGSYLSVRFVLHNAWIRFDGVPKGREART